MLRKVSATARSLPLILCEAQVHVLLMAGTSVRALLAVNMKVSLYVCLDVQIALTGIICILDELGRVLTA